MPIRNLVDAMSRRTRKLAHRGDWQPAHLTRSDNTVIIATMCLLALARAYDYGFGMDERPAPLIDGKPASVVSIASAFPLWAWALALGSSVFALVAGALVRKHVVVWLAHALSWTVYLALFAATLAPVLDRPYWDGLRGATPLLGPVVIHFLFWLRTGRRPLPPDHAAPAEIVQRPS